MFLREGQGRGSLVVRAEESAILIGVPGERTFVAIVRGAGHCSSPAEEVEAGLTQTSFCSRSQPADTGR